MEAADLLLRSHAAPASRLKPARSVPQLHSHSRTTAATTTTPYLHGKSKQEQPSGSLLSSVLSRTVHGVGDLWLGWQDGLTAEERRVYQSREDKKRALCMRMKTADSFKQWESAARELDILDANEQWKLQDSFPYPSPASPTPSPCPSSCDYNPDLLRDRLRDLEDARASGDVRAMMHLIRTALSRDLAGMDNVDLYRHSYVGTKRLIERYVQSALCTIDTVVEHVAAPPTRHLSTSPPASTLSHKDLLESMLLSRQSFGRSALLLSGGGTFGMSHVGVLKALFQADLLPRIISGASAGSIVCAVMCTRTDEEMPELIRQFPYGDLAVFESELAADTVLDHLGRLLTEGSWSDIKHLIRVMRSLTGDITFQEAYNRTRRILNICVSTASVFEMPRLLNYVTAPNVMVWSAVAASCSVPLVFNSSPLLVKDPVTGEHRPWAPSPQHFIDGSVDNDLPMTRLAEMFNVNHFIVSQVNPHVVPFLSRDDHLSPDADKAQRARLLRDNPNNNNRDASYDWVQTFTSLARDEALHRLQFMTEMGILPNLTTKLRSILSQKYSGDITILPEISMHDLPRLLKNPSSDFMLRSCLQGERATWPKLSRIRDRCAIELQLDRAVHKLRAHVVFAEGRGQSPPALSVNSGTLRVKSPSSIHVNAQQQQQQQQQQRQQSQPHVGMDCSATRRRHRRRSGGSVQTLPDAQLLRSSDGTTTSTTDEDGNSTAEEDGWGWANAATGRHVSSSLLAVGKPRLHRASKSQIHMPLPRDMSHPRAAAANAMPSKPRSTGHRTPKRDRSRPGIELVVPPAATDLWHGGGVGGDGSIGGGSINGGVLTSPTDDVDTSEHGRWSDAAGGCEMGTEESDPDPYEKEGDE